MGIKSIRRMIFFILMTIIPITVISDICCFVDPTLIIYSFMSIMSLLCFLIFAGWWFKKGKASEIYVAITLLLFGTFWTNAFNLMARYYIVYERKDDAMNLFLSNWWQYRTIVQLLIISYLFAFSVSRLISGNHEETK